METIFRYKWTIALAVTIAALGGALYYAWPRPSEAQYVSGDFTAVSDGQTFAGDGASNVFLGSFLLPNPQTDTLVHDGATNTVGAKNVLTAFSSTEQMYDTDNDGGFDDGEGIVSSANTTIESTDTVLTTATNALTSLATSEGASLLLYVDQGATTDSYDNGEDIYAQYYNGGAASTTNGITLKTFTNTTAFFDLDFDGVIDVGSFTTLIGGEQIMTDSDADGHPSAGDIGNSGLAGVTALSTAMSVCFDGSVSNDAEYDANEIVWYDIAGDCSSFSSGVDVILLGNSAPSGTSTEFGTEGEIAYLEATGNSSYTCTRTGTCEALVYTGADGANWTTGQNLLSTAIFFDSSTEATNGIATTGTGWDESGGAELLVPVNSLMSAGEPKYVFRDGDAGGGAFAGSNNDAANDDIYVLIKSGATATTANNNTFRTFDADEKLLFVPGLSIYNGTNAAVVRSADAHLTAGALDGSGTDTVLTSAASALDGVPAGTRYFDHNSSGSYADGDDIVSDVDGSGYYNADDLLTLAVDTYPTGQDITDANLTALYAYEMTGSTCAGSGTDTLLGSDVSTPFLDQAITITKAVYAASDSTASRTICMYADAANVATHGKIFRLNIETGDADFASSGTSPTPDFTVTTAGAQFVGGFAAATTPLSTRAGATTTYSVAFTPAEDDIPTNGGILVAFPTGFSTTSATMSCTDDGVAITGTQTISSPVIRLTNTGSPVAAGSIVGCTISGVVNTTSAGQTGTFLVKTYANSAGTRGLEVDENNTVTITSTSSAEYIPPAAASMTVTAPNGGEALTEGDVATIAWSSTATSFVNLDYSIDGGVTWIDIVSNIVNGEEYRWTVPEVDTSTALVRVTATDLATEGVSDVSDAVFAIASSDDVSSPTNEDDGAQEPVTDISGVSAYSFVMGASSPTVYYVDAYMARRPFIDETTFLTYGATFRDVAMLADDVLAQLPLGAPMLPKPGSMLAKFADSSEVYWIATADDGGTLLLHIPTEAIAAKMFGDRWADYVTDVPATLWAQFVIEGELVGDEGLDTSNLRKRYEIDGIFDTDGDGYGDTEEFEHGYDPMRPAPARL